MGAPSIDKEQYVYEQSDHTQRTSNNSYGMYNHYTTGGDDLRSLHEYHYNSCTGINGSGITTTSMSLMTIHRWPDDLPQLLTAIHVECLL